MCFRRVSLSVSGRFTLDSGSDCVIYWFTITKLIEQNARSDHANMVTAMVFSMGMIHLLV